MPDPFTLRRSKSAGDMPHSQVHARTWGCERLVHLDEVHVLEPQVGPCQGGRRRGHGPDAHGIRTNAGDAAREQSGQRPQAEVVGVRSGRHDARGGAIVLTTRVSGRDGCIRIGGAEHRREGREGLECHVVARVFIASHHGQPTLPVTDRHRDDLGVEPSFGLCRHGPLVR
jgi:hypothetical protein